MALAEFIDKAALAASHVLQRFDYTAFVKKLEGCAVLVGFDGSAASSAEGVTTLDLLVNLLARLYPTINLVPLGKSSRVALPRLVSLAQGINPSVDVRIGTSTARADASVVVGQTRIPAAKRCTYVGSDGWVVRLSARKPVGSGLSVNPFGAAGAACFGAANVFRTVFAQSLFPRSGRDKGFVFSLVDYDPRAMRPANPELGAVDLGVAHIVGLGAIGCGAAWCLARLNTVKGTLHLVDPEALELGNLQRYILPHRRDVDRPKVEVARDTFSGTGLQVLAHHQRWGQYLCERGNCAIEAVAVALDTAQDRIAVQASLPRWIVNAWTQTGDLGVSRHTFLADEACLACLYLPDRKVPDEDELVAKAIGLPQSLMEVRTLLYNNRPIGKDLLGRIATALTIPLEHLLQFEEQPLRAFYSKAVCGGLVLKFAGKGQQDSQAEVPLAFQSALAGTMLAAEIVIDACGMRRSPIPTISRINLLQPLAQYLNFPARKHPSGRCICQDADYVAAFSAKHLRS
jgi:molybdopterin/thiamine biosynthesis adenylyltransferase